MTRCAEVRFEREHRCDFVLQHLADGNAGPAGDHFADDLRIDADAHQRRFALLSVKLGVQFVQFGAQRFRIIRQLHRRRGG